jgi:hypothetical protein
MCRFIQIVISTLILAENATMAQTSPDEDLLSLARKRFIEVSSKDEREAFEKLLSQTQRGERADFTPDLKQQKDPQMELILTDPVYADVWALDRIIKAEWLVWLCTDPRASAKVTSKGIDIAGVRIDGELNLTWAKVQFPLRAFKCAFTKTIVLNRSILPSLDLQGTRIKEGLHGDGLTVDRDMVCTDGFRADAPVFLRDARIGRSLKCDGGQFVNPTGTALDLENARSGPIYLRKGYNAKGESVPFTAEGEVDLENAAIAGNLDCSGGVFAKGAEANIYALRADEVQVEGGVYLGKGFRAEGEVSLHGAKVGSSLDCSGGQFINPRGSAVDATAANIQDSVLLTSGFEAHGRVVLKDSRIEHDFLLEDVAAPEKAILDLRFAKAKTLLNQESSWPEQDNLLLHGFIFDDFASKVPGSKVETWDTTTQINWIHLQKREEFISQPYEQLAAVLRNMGLQEEAVEVMIAKNKDRGRHVSMFDASVEFIWYNTFGPFIGFGYRPWNALFASLAIIALGVVLFGAGKHCDIVTPTEGDAYVPGGHEKRELTEWYPRFNALTYSLETFVPFLQLDMRQYWAPNSTRLNRLQIAKVPLPINGPVLRWYLWCHIIAGWVLTTLWVGGLTGLLKS